MQMASLMLADSSVELSCWNLCRLRREGIREAVPWFDPHFQGAGYWVWKPFIILKELEHLQDGDYLLYTDAGRPPEGFSAIPCSRSSSGWKRRGRI